MLLETLRPRLQVEPVGLILFTFLYLLCLYNVKLDNVRDPTSYKVVNATQKALLKTELFFKKVQHSDDNVLIATAIDTDWQK